MLFCDPKTKKQYTEKTLKKHGISKSNVYPLTNETPSFNKLTEYIKNNGIRKNGEIYKVKYEVLPLPVEIAEENIKKEQDRLRLALNKLCDEKQSAGRNLIAGQSLTGAVLVEYKRKQDAVRDNDISFFAGEAFVLGTTPEEEFAKTKYIMEKYLEMDDGFIKLIASYRRGTGKHIDNANFSKVAELLLKGEELGATTTISGIKEMMQ